MITLSNFYHDLSRKNIFLFFIENEDKERFIIPMEI